MDNKAVQFRPSEIWKSVEVLSEGLVVMTSRGFAPALRVRVGSRNLEQLLFIGSRSISTMLEEMRLDNDGSFVGLRFEIRKDGPEKTASYEFR